MTNQLGVVDGKFDVTTDNKIDGGFKTKDVELNFNATIHSSESNQQSLPPGPASVNNKNQETESETGADGLTNMQDYLNKVSSGEEEFSIEEFLKQLLAMLQGGQGAEDASCPTCGADQTSMGGKGGGGGDETSAAGMGGKGGGGGDETSAAATGDEDMSLEDLLMQLIALLKGQDEEGEAADMLNQQSPAGKGGKGGGGGGGETGAAGKGGKGGGGCGGETSAAGECGKGTEKTDTLQTDKSESADEVESNSFTDQLDEELGLEPGTMDNLFKAALDGDQDAFVETLQEVLAQQQESGGTTGSSQSMDALARALGTASLLFATNGNDSGANAAIQPETDTSLAA